MENKDKIELPQLTAEAAAVSPADRTAVDSPGVPVDEPPVKKRYYHVDWIRSLAVHLVIFIHCTNLALEIRQRRAGFKYEDGYDDMTKEYVTEEEKISGIQRSLLQIGIPAFFYISGFAATFHDTEARGAWAFFKARFWRLIVPFVIALFVCLVPRLYLTQNYSFPSRVEEDLVIDNFFTFYKRILPKLVTKLSWLWFIPALFFDSMVNYPLLKVTQRRKQGLPWQFKHEGLSLCWLVLVLGVWAGACFFASETRELATQHLVPSVGVLLIAELIFMTVPGWIIGQGYQYSLLLRLIGPLFHIALNFFKDGNEYYALYGFLTVINYDLIFMAQGIIDQVYAEEQKRAKEELAQTIWMPLAFFLFFFLYAITSPMGFSNTGYNFYYPLYDHTYLQSFHTTGSWLWIYTVMALGENYLNHQFDAKWFTLIVDQSLFVYLYHYLGIAILSRLVIENSDLQFVGISASLFVMTEILILGISLAKVRAQNYIAIWRGNQVDKA